MENEGLKAYLRKPIASEEGPPFIADPIKKYPPPEAQRLRQKSRQKTNVTTSLSLLPCNEPHFFTWAERNWP